jgi:vitamin B12 transporter
LLIAVSATTMQSFFCNSLYAQGTDTGKAVKDTLKGQSLKEVSVRAGRISSRNTSATPVQVLKGADLEKLNSLSVADAIRFFSGVQLKDYGGIGGLKTINVRSLGSNHVDVFYDGVAIGNAQNGQVDLGKFSLDNIDEIALYNGQQNTIFQPAKGFSSASSIYLTSKAPKFTDSNRSNEMVSFRAGSSGLVNPSFLWQYKLSDNVYSTISTEWTKANGRYKFRYTNGVYDTTAVRNNGDIDAQRVEAGLNGKLADSSTWSAKAYLYNSDRGLPGAIVANRFNYDQRQWDRNIFLQASYKKDFSKQYGLIANFKYSNDYERYLDPDYVTITGLLDNKFKQQEIYASLANRYRINSFWDVAISTDYLWNTLNANLYHFAYPTRITFLTDAATEFHFKRVNIQASVLGTFLEDKVKQYASAGNKREYTPALLLSWQPFENPDFRLRTFYKRIFRMPTFNDLYYTFIGNTFLRPEYTNQYDAGFTYNKTFNGHVLKYFAIQTDGYYNNVTDKIIAVPSANLFRWTMYNLGKVNITGADVNVQAEWELSSEIHVNTTVNYTYQKVLNAENGDNGSVVPYVPGNSGSLLINTDYRKFSLNYSFLYTGYRYDEQTAGVYTYQQPWYTHDVSLDYHTKISKHLLKLTAEVNNLLNQHYDVIPNFPLPGINYRFKMSFNY